MSGMWAEVTGGPDDWTPALEIPRPDPRYPELLRAIEDEEHPGSVGRRLPCRDLADHGTDVRENGTESSRGYVTGARWGHGGWTVPMDHGCSAFCACPGAISHHPWAQTRR